ncbi:MAG: S41 family peptidase [Gammaproteobacteria bacterium]|nr:S41 family peptidase [Gammaproteobacteria bacterium]MCY4358682.1 S41 family peptidase [Gammaproteobacteria bacterium]
MAQFRQGTGEEVVKEIARLHQQHGELKGLVLDLHNNPGGVLQASVR